MRTSHSTNVILAVLVAALSVAAFSVATIPATAQYLKRPQMHVECHRGVYWVAASGQSQNGRIAIGGEKGRYGTKRASEETFRWRCLPNEFMIFAIACTDSVVALGGEGGYVWIVPVEEDGNYQGEDYLSVSLPQSDTVMALNISGQVLHAATASGKIWSRTLGAQDTWTLEYDGDRGFLAINDGADQVVACGKEGRIVRRLGTDPRWREVPLDGLSTDGLVLSAVTITDSMIYVGTSRPSVIRISESGAVLDETTVIAPNLGVRNDHLGLPERVLQIIVRHDTTWLCGFFTASSAARNGTSIHRSVDGGRTYRRFRYMDLFGPLLRTDVIPLLRVREDSIFALSTTLNHPITQLTGSIRDSVLTFTSQQNIWEEYLRTDGTSQGLQSTVVHSLLAHPDGERLVAGLMKGSSGSSDESQTHVCVIQPRGNATLIDTISRIPTPFILQAMSGAYVVGHDYLGFPRCSFDSGRTWQPSRVPDSIRQISLLGVSGVMMFDSLLLCSSRQALMVADTGLRNWTTILPDAGADTITRFSPVARSGPQRFLVVQSSWVDQRLVHERVREYEFRGREVVVIDEHTIPGPFASTASSAFADNGVITVISTLPSEILPDRLFQYRLCAWVDSDWRCSMMSLGYPDGQEVAQFTGSVMLESASDDIIVLRSGTGSNLYGFLEPRIWQRLPAIERQRSINHRFVILNNQMYVGGDFHGLYSYEMNDVITSVDSDGSQERSLQTTSSDLRQCDGPDYVYTLQGSFVSMSPIDVRVDGVYIIRSCDGHSDLAMIVDGRIVARQAP